jgi:hypoxanthine-DNA glycosylase
MAKTDRNAGERIRSFPPIESPDARILILGSMPGVASLRARQYYAHPRNQFWRIMGALYGATPQRPYAQRIALLQENGVAVWDVLHSCVRRGSLDSAIENASVAPNDLPEFLRQHRKITAVRCNGALAYAAFRRYFGAACLQDFPWLDCRRLPSTSPAHASWSYARKSAAWRAALMATGARRA